MGEMEEAGQRGQHFRQLGEIHFSVLLPTMVPLLIVYIQNYWRSRL